MAWNPTGLSDNLAGNLNAAAVDVPGLLFNLLVSIALLLIGYFVSGFAGRLVQSLLDYLKVEIILQKYRVEDALGGTQITPLLATASRWYVMLFFLTVALDVLNVPSVNWFFASILRFAPVALGAGLLVIVAAITGEWVREAILDLHKFYAQKSLAELSRWFIVLVSVVIALDTMGFQTAFLREVFNTLVQGISWGIALAFGLAFGLGGQKDAQDLIKKARRQLKF